MTNSEYEAACVTAAAQSARFEGEHKLKQLDAAIAVLEGSLSKLQAERREIVNRYDLNRYDLNRCVHDWRFISDESWDQYCTKCGAEKWPK